MTKNNDQKNVETVDSTKKEIRTPIDPSVLCLEELMQNMEPLKKTEQRKELHKTEDQIIYEVELFSNKKTLGKVEIKTGRNLLGAIKLYKLSGLLERANTQEITDVGNKERVARDPKKAKEKADKALKSLQSYAKANGLKMEDLLKMANGKADQ